MRRPWIGAHTAGVLTLSLVAGPALGAGRHPGQRWLRVRTCVLDDGQLLRAGLRLRHRQRRAQRHQRVLRRRDRRARLPAPDRRNPSRRALQRRLLVGERRLPAESAAGRRRRRPAAGARRHPGAAVCGTARKLYSNQRIERAAVRLPQRLRPAAPRRRPRRRDPRAGDQPADGGRPRRPGAARPSPQPERKAMKLDLVKRIGALLAGTLLIGCGGGGSSAPLVDAASTDAAAEAARVAAAMTTTTPVPRECATE